MTFLAPENNFLNWISHVSPCVLFIYVHILLQSNSYHLCRVLDDSQAAVVLLAELSTLVPPSIFLQPGWEEVAMAPPPEPVAWTQAAPGVSTQEEEAKKISLHAPEPLIPWVPSAVWGWRQKKIPYLEWRFGATCSDHEAPFDTAADAPAAPFLTL